jgi:dTDP-4-amino-4,6-dideoxygalactose transaminase
MRSKICAKRLKASLKLAADGGRKICSKPWPERHLIGKEEKKAVAALFDKTIASGKAFGYNGPEEIVFCEQFAKFMGGGYADAVNSGTTAVYVALRALNLEPFTEVIVGPITDPGGMMPIPLLGCIPVVADTAPGSFNTGPEQIEKLITPLTSAILVAHIQGEPADMEGIMRVARKHNIPVVEDCAQAHYATINGRLVGTFGKASAFSTMFGKHFCTGGQGGVVYTRDKKIYENCRRVSDRGKPFFLPSGSTNSVASLNYNLNDLAAVIGSIQLKKLPGIVQKRRLFVKRLKTELRGIKAFSFPPLVKGANPSYWHLRLEFHPEAVTCDKATYCKVLMAEGLPGISTDYHALVHTYDWFKNKRVFGTSRLPWSSPLYKGKYADGKFECPNATRAIKEHFILTFYESWGKREADDLIRIFRRLDEVFSK